MPLIQGLDNARKHGHLLRAHFQVTVPQKQKIVLQPQDNRMIRRQGFHQREHGIHGFVERGIRSSMDPRCLDEDVQLSDELNPQHGQLLVEDIPGF